MTNNKPLSLEFVQKAIQNPLMNEKCCDLHQGSCIQRLIQHFFIGAKSFSKLYFAFMFASFIFYRKKQILYNPKQQFKKFLKGFVKSVLFSGGYLGICRAVICIVTKLYAYSNVSTILSATLGGLSLVFQPTERQPQIALFIFTNTLQTIYNMAVRRNIPVRIPHGMCILYALSMSIICYHYFNNKETMKNNYVQFLDRLLANS